jgi:hypothetical protein
LFDFDASQALFFVAGKALGDASDLEKRLRVGLEAHWEDDIGLG